MEGATLTAKESAEFMGISEATIIRKLRRELPAEEKARILAVIEKFRNLAC